MAQTITDRHARWTSRMQNLANGLDDAARAGRVDPAGWPEWLRGYLEDFRKANAAYLGADEDPRDAERRCRARDTAPFRRSV